MRIVAGSAGGRRLQAPAGGAVRPTTERVREAVFSSLLSRSALEGARVLDLFAGSGAMGIEALSRGAGAATFVESDPRAVAAIEANLAATGLVADATVAKADVLAFLKRAAGTWDIAFVDPPYEFRRWPWLLEAIEGPIGKGILVIESSREVELGERWVSVSTRRHGGTVVTFARPH